MNASLHHQQGNSTQLKTHYTAQSHTRMTRDWDVIAAHRKAAEEASYLVETDGPIAEIPRQDAFFCRKQVSHYEVGELTLEEMGVAPHDAARNKAACPTIVGCVSAQSTTVGMSKRLRTNWCKRKLPRLLRRVTRACSKTTGPFL